MHFANTDKPTAVTPNINVDSYGLPGIHMISHQKSECVQIHAETYGCYRRWTFAQTSLHFLCDIIFFRNTFTFRWNKNTFFKDERITGPITTTQGRASQGH